MTAVRIEKQDALSHERLIQLLYYEPITGIFTWRVRRQSVAPGARAGSRNSSDGYRGVVINRKTYYEHRLAWFYVHKEWPAGDIDHINGNPADNRLANLRPATRGQNNINAHGKVRARSGYRGVSTNYSRRRYRARLTVNGKVLQLGCFETAEAAAEKVASERRKHFGEFVP